MARQVSNAALVVGWAPHDALIGLSRVHWAMILAGLIVLVIFVLSARRKPNKSELDMSAMARSIEIHMPNASTATKVRVLRAMLQEIDVPEPKVVESKLVELKPANPTESAGSQNGTATFHGPNQAGNSQKVAQRQHGSR